MSRFDDLVAFAAVGRECSFTRAAAQMGVSPTEAGERLYLTVGPRLADIEAELVVLGELRGKPAGTVRITATEHAVQTLIWPRLRP